MKKISSLLGIAILIFICEKSIAQNTFPSSGAAGIGTTSPNSTSLLDITSTTKGVLIPRMTKTQRDAIVSPAVGLMLYQTNSTPGFYYYDGTTWTAVSPKNANKTLNNLTAPTAVNVDLLPATTATTNLGSSSFRWKDAYINNVKFSDGTTMSTASGGGGGISGSGTTNYIPKFTGSTSLGNSLLQDDGSKMYIGPTSFWTFAKMNIEQSTHDYTLNLVNAQSGTAGVTGIYNIFSGTSTGSKTGIRNEVGVSSSGTGVIMGTDNSISNNGTGISYGSRNFLSGTGNGIVYGTYSQFTSGGSGAKYGDYYDFSGVTGSGTQYGTYMNANYTGTVYGSYYNITGGGTITGSYINLPTTSGTTKYGLRVNAASTSGLTYGIYSSVATSNPSAYAGYFDGQVKCADKLGIGTTNALTVKLQVDNGADAEPSSGGYLVVGNVSTSNIAIDNNEIMARTDGQTAKLFLNNDGGDVSMCYAGGNVMIGSSIAATGYLLTVDGKIICEELKVQLSEDWPDYVFDEKYKMPSISDLKSFVKANKHLPGIPTATELNKNGISVGDMQTKMMQKIEELSLYIIQLQEEIDALKQSHN